VFPKIFLLHKVVLDAKKVEKHCSTGYLVVHGNLKLNIIQ